MKIAPGLSLEELIQVADSLVRHNIDGVIATNTTLDRSLVQECNIAMKPVASAVVLCN
nr:dihydroorotate dehydrogenase 2 [Raoultella sp. NCTC 9187]